MLAFHPSKSNNIHPQILTRIQPLGFIHSFIQHTHTHTKQKTKATRGDDEQEAYASSASVHQWACAQAAAGSFEFCMLRKKNVDDDRQIDDGGGEQIGRMNACVPTSFNTICVTLSPCPWTYSHITGMVMGCNFSTVMGTSSLISSSPSQKIKYI